MIHLNLKKTKQGEFSQKQSLKNLATLTCNFVPVGIRNDACRRITETISLIIRLNKDEAS
jgi:hypothetical protein